MRVRELKEPITYRGQRETKAGWGDGGGMVAAFKYLMDFLKP